MSSKAETLVVPWWRRADLGMVNNTSPSSMLSLASIPYSATVPPLHTYTCRCRNANQIRYIKETGKNESHSNQRSSHRHWLHQQIQGIIPYCSVLDPLGCTTAESSAGDSARSPLLPVRSSHTRGFKSQNSHYTHLYIVNTTICESQVTVTT